MHRSTTWTDMEGVMQNGTKRDMRTRRHGPTVGPYSDRSEGSKRKLSRPAGVGYTDAKGNYERYMALARTAGSTGDSTEKAYPSPSGRINILYVMGFAARPIARSARKAA